VTETPQCRVLDIVELDSESPAGGTGRLVVTSVRRHADGSHRYGLAGLDDSDDQRAGLYDRDQLRPTGARADLAHFAVPGQFKHRDLVEVSAAYDDPHVAGLTGEVDGWQEPHGELPLLISVWFAEIAEVYLLPESALTATGRQARREVPGQPGSSIFVSGDGELVGQVDYVLVDDVSFYL
jgi:hypothetical protein